MRLIDADVASRWMEQNEAYMDADILRAIPTVDAQVVVRCKDCKYHYDGCVHFCNWFGLDCPNNLDFYCAYGERKN